MDTGIYHGPLIWNGEVLWRCVVHAPRHERSAALYASRSPSRSLRPRSPAPSISSSPTATSNFDTRIHRISIRRSHPRSVTPEQPIRKGDETAGSAKTVRRKSRCCECGQDICDRTTVWCATFIARGTGCNAALPSWECWVVPTNRPSAAKVGCWVTYAKRGEK